MLEIIIAIFIFAIIVTSLFSTYRGMLSDAKAIGEGTVASEMVKNCLNRMIVDLQSVYVTYPPAYEIPDMNDPPDPYRFVGQIKDTGESTFPQLRFASLAHVGLEGSTAEGIAEIVYYVQETEDNGYVLRRADNLYPYREFEEKKGDPVLCESIKVLKFTYYDQEGQESDVWDSESESSGYATPTSVGIALEVAGVSGAVNLETRVTLPLYRVKKEGVF